MGELIIKEISYIQAKDITIKNHYSKKWNTSFGKVNFGIFRGRRILGVAVYGNLMQPKSYKNWCDELVEGQVVELNRLWIDDELGHNAETIFMSATFKILRKDHPHIKVIQTFADGRLGCGTIYKASSFNYYGYTETTFFYEKEKDISHHEIPFTNSKRPTRMLMLNRLFFDNKLEPFKVKTYRYGFVLDKKFKKKIKFIQQPYPIYEKGQRDMKDYLHPKGIVARCYLFFKELGDKDYMKKSKDYYYKNYNDFDDEIENQKQNDSYTWFINEFDMSTLKLEINQISIFDLM
jgi:hypothetical protein